MASRWPQRCSLENCLVMRKTQTKGAAAGLRMLLDANCVMCLTSVVSESGLTETQQHSIAGLNTSCVVEASFLERCKYATPSYHEGVPSMKSSHHLYHSIFIVKVELHDSQLPTAVAYSDQIDP